MNRIRWFVLIMLFSLLAAACTAPAPASAPSEEGAAVAEEAAELIESGCPGDDGRPEQGP